jgi:hypothetical protein
MRFRFTIRTLLGAVAVIAVIAALVARYLEMEHRFQFAQANYERAKATEEAGLASRIDVCVESFLLYFAERDRWFRSGAALQNHLDRLKLLEEQTDLQVEDDGRAASAAQIRALIDRSKKNDF